jgi:hypothetical protein
LTTWNWSFAKNNGLASGSGTFTSADLAPTANADIQVTGISGTVTENGNTFAIISLNSILNNIFRWDGSPASKLLVNSTSLGSNPQKEFRSLHRLAIIFLPVAILVVATFCQWINLTPPAQRFPLIHPQSSQSSLQLPFRAPCLCSESPRPSAPAAACDSGFSFTTPGKPEPQAEYSFPAAPSIKTGLFVARSAAWFRRRKSAGRRSCDVP